MDLRDAAVLNETSAVQHGNAFAERELVVCARDVDDRGAVNAQRAEELIRQRYARGRGDGLEQPVCNEQRRTQEVNPREVHARALGCRE